MSDDYTEKDKRQLKKYYRKQISGLKRPGS